MKIKEKIDRNNFLKKIGFSGAALFALYTLDSCKNEDGTTPSATDNTIDLTNPTFAKLKTSGGYIVNNGIVIANNGGTYIAATLTCSHEGRKEITFTNSQWYCTAHGAKFDTTGKGLNSEAKGGLKQYNVTVAGNILTIT